MSRGPATPLRLATLLLIGAAAHSLLALDTVEEDGAAITFLANEGVLLSTAAGGGPEVLIDALYERYDSYAVPADSTQTSLETARAPFEAVDLVLVTHRHGDHFHPKPVAGHLQANPEAVLVTSEQVVDSLRAQLASELVSSPRIVSRTTPTGRRRRMLVNGLPIELLGVPHGGRRHRRVEHLAFLVDVGGRRILHVGDAELSEETLAPFRLDTARVDVALLPWWALTDDESLRAVRRWIRPRRVAAFHISDSDSARVRREVTSAVPGVHVFSRSLERVVF